MQVTCNRINSDMYLHIHFSAGMKFKLKSPNFRYGPFLFIPELDLCLSKFHIYPMCMEKISVIFWHIKWYVPH